MSEHHIGRLETLPDGVGTRFDFGEDRIAVFRVGDDVYAIGDRCSHAEASLSEGELFGLEIECPRHGAEFDITTGEALSLPATKPVPCYRTAVRGGEVFITIKSEVRNG
ncbi:MAG: non-heme iron oxygenase ferredoxin subunit [Acidimicrobiia bacterium]|nr:non-heme iron oxygenase ferredoxin subunit [Acidimicrobiia bacterium]